MASLVLVLSLGGCVLGLPVDGEEVRGFAPAGAYGGHWGVDLSAPTGTRVRAAEAGVVSFAGPVAGRLSVTIDHGGGVRTSYSYLESILVAMGSNLRRGDPVGRSGLDHGLEAVHFSVRIGSRYVKPVLGACRLFPGDAVTLQGAGPIPSYSRLRANRRSGRHLRPTPRRSSHRRRGGSPRARTGGRPVHAGRVAVAEGRP